VVREAGIADIHAIRALMNSVAGFWDESWRPDVLERAVGSPDTIALVHQGGHVLDGFICAHDLGFRAYLSEFVVAPHVQRKGIGTGLLAEVERRVAERGSLRDSSPQAAGQDRCASLSLRPTARSGFALGDRRPVEAAAGRSAEAIVLISRDRARRLGRERAGRSALLPRRLH
jgi:ribosomal protein S18 acetylase RimI-like enzyme